MERIIKGRVIWKFGDHFNSDLIVQYPKYASVSDKEGLTRICMIGLDPEFPKKVKKGEIMVAGRNFGYGHPHSQAHKALKAVGISAVIADSFSSGWFRKAIHLGLPVLACKSVSKKVSQGDELEVDFETGKIKNITTGEEIKTAPLPNFVMQILETGGLPPYLKKKTREPTINLARIRRE